MASKNRYWWLVILSVVWILLSMVIRGLDGQKGPGLVSILWFGVAVYAFQGNTQRILMITKLALVIQLFVGLIVFVLLLNDPAMQSIFGQPTVFLISILIPSLLWIPIFLWARSKCRQERQNASTSDKVCENESFTNHGDGDNGSSSSTSEGTKNDLGFGSQLRSNASSIAIALMAVFLLILFASSWNQESETTSKVEVTNKVPKWTVKTVQLDAISSEWLRGWDGSYSTLRVLVKNTSPYAISVPEIRAKTESCDSDNFSTRLAQQALKRRGYNVGPVDGILGEMTKSAIASYQRQNGLTVSRELDGVTLRSLGFSDDSFEWPAFGRGVLVGSNKMSPGVVGYVDFLDFALDAREEFCFYVISNVRVRKD